MRYILSVCFVLLAALAPAQQKSLRLLYDSIPSNIRALSVVSDQVLWMAGSKGYVARSVNGGRSFTQLPVPGGDSSDFRTLYAFDDKRAVLANTSSPARIYHTSDGVTWNLVYENAEPAAFIDGVSFWNEKEGMLYGDPIDNKLLLLRTVDGGETWESLPDEVRPATIDGEASFAASGTGIRCYGTSHVMISTGGKVSRILLSDDKGDTWESMVTPMMQGTESSGIFSFDLSGAEHWVIAGGDYTRDTLAVDHVFFTTDAGNSWQTPVNPTLGYRECVTFVDKYTVFAAGPSGIDVSTSGGRNWEAFSSVKGVHTLQKARNGARIFFAGKGIFGVID